MFIPGFLISMITFPGVMVHELAHVAFCKFTGTRVLKVCYFQLDNPAGYVIHEQPSTVWRHILIGVGPFFVNTFVGFMLGMVAIPMHMNVLEKSRLADFTGSEFLLFWLGLSIAMHAFPSTGDARSIWHALWSEAAPISAKLVGTPVVIVIFAGAIASIFWLDVLYGFGVVSAAGALQNASQRYDEPHSPKIAVLDEQPDPRDLVPVGSVPRTAPWSPPSDSYEQVLAKISREMNATLPRQVDEQTRIDTTISGPGRRLTYVYTFLGVSAEDIDWNALTATLRPSIVNGYKTSPDMAELRAKGVELRYRYRDMAGKHIGEITVSPSDF